MAVTAGTKPVGERGEESVEGVEELYAKGMENEDDGDERWKMMMKDDDDDDDDDDDGAS